MRIEDGKFYLWITEQPLWIEEGCLVCGRTAERAHLRSRGAGGSDHFLLPLCHEHHMESHERPEFWFKWKECICRWFACSLPKIHAEYKRLIEAEKLPRPAQMEDLI